MFTGPQLKEIILIRLMEIQATSAGRLMSTDEIINFIINENPEIKLSIKKVLDEQRNEVTNWDVLEKTFGVDVIKRIKGNGKQ